MSVLIIDRCVCRQRTFAELLQVALEWDGDVDCVMLLTGAGLQCGRCRPWLRQALQQRVPEIVVDLAGQRDATVLVAHFSNPSSTP
ncbi:bacterioferritin-associated ferredoxin [Chitinivorax tropicus]|uniref:Bacterioferritin-associated ferredoxin n=1 Tax=Chitinivorax tropicus TaxID=714531 RepID=A0A840MPN5_9PROT|nr:hypothetical protein [Chitinivorax tropicus]MBB5018446.1 bacterioferritin-associated ferredoxin [Chitinivorax tropicus]